jgi:hypothetical protein
VSPIRSEIQRLDPKYEIAPGQRARISAGLLACAWLIQRFIDRSEIVWIDHLRDCPKIHRLDFDGAPSRTSMAATFGAADEPAWTR